MRALLLVPLVGCATVTGGSRDPSVTITSTVPGASVTVDGEPCGVTPTAVTMSRRSEHKVVVAHPGCEPAVVTVQRRFNPWVLGNIVIGGPIGLVVDVAAESTHTLSPCEVNVNLKPNP